MQTNHEAPAIPRPVHVWKQIPREKRIEVAQAFWADEESFEQQIEAIELIARQMKFRPKSVRALDLDRKSRYLAGLQTTTDTIAARALVTYHLVAQRPMLGRFLDLLEISHQDGLIVDENTPRPAPERLEPAATQLATEYPAESVRLYLSTLLSQDPETWGGLAPVLEKLP